MAAMESKISSLPPLSAADQAEDRGDLDTASDHRCTVLAKLALRIAKDRQNDAASWDVLLTEPMLPGHCVWPHLNIRELHRLGRASASLQKSAMVALQALPRPVLFEESPGGRTFPIGKTLPSAQSCHAHPTASYQSTFTRSESQTGAHSRRPLAKHSSCSGHGVYCTPM